MIFEEHVSLGDLTTFRVGGAARYFARIESLEALQEALRLAHERGLKLLLLGGGSNVLVSESGFDGLVLKLEMRGMEREGDTLVVAAGEKWDALVERSVEEGLWGLENLSGIPGLVGAAPVQNIGAYGAELKDSLAWLEAYDTEEGVVRRFKKEACGFGYRTSIFKKEAGRFVVLRAAFSLAPDGAPNASYKDLAGAEFFTLLQVREKVLSIRAAKFPDLSIEGTAGSFFLNPIVNEAEAAALLVRYPELPNFKAEGGVKLSLAWILDRVLDVKGLAEGGARLFEKQPLVIVASRNASAQDVERLAEKVSVMVKKECGIKLEREVRTIS
jgi:UDP-N-acetylmuramate dehydrogenase